MMPASGNENDLNMPSGTMKSSCGVTLKWSGLCQQWTEQPNEHRTMMWSVLLQPVVLAAVERQGEALE